MAQRLVRTTRFQSSTPTAGPAPEMRQTCLASEIAAVNEFFYMDGGTERRYTDIVLKGSSSVHLQCCERYEDVMAQWLGIGAVRQDAATEE